MRHISMRHMWQSVPIYPVLNAEKSRHLKRNAMCRTAFGDALAHFMFCECFCDYGNQLIMGLL